MRFPGEALISDDPSTDSEDEDPKHQPAVGNLANVGVSEKEKKGEWRMTAKKGQWNLNGENYLFFFVFVFLVWKELESYCFFFHFGI